MMAIGYTRTQAEARLMAEAGVEAICMNFNLNPAANAGELAEISLQEIAARAAEMARVAHSVNRNIVCLLGGGPISKPDELMDVCRETGTQGFIGGSSLNRVPLETSVLEVTSGFKTIHLLREKVDLLERQLQLSGLRHGVIAQSPVMKMTLEVAKRLGSGVRPVLVVGEPGTGKRRIANFVHAVSSRRRTKPFVVPCRAAPPSALLENVLQGGGWHSAASDRSARVGFQIHQPRRCRSKIFQGMRKSAWPISSKPAPSRRFMHG